MRVTRTSLFNRALVALLAMGTFGLAACQPTVPTTTTSATGSCATSNELFCTSFPYAFADKTTGAPVAINGVSLKRGPYMGGNGVWATNPYITRELDAMASKGAPGFNTVRIFLDWPYFQNADGSANEAAYQQLDLLIDRAKQDGIYVILVPIAQRGPGSYCSESRMVGAHLNVPKWAWTDIGMSPDNTCDATIPNSSLSYFDYFGKVLKLPQTTEYLRTMISRYDGSTPEGKQVIAFDLVNEPRGDASAVPGNYTTLQKQMMDLRDNVYGPWLAPSGPMSLRSVDPDKIFILEPVTGAASIANVNLSSLAQPDVVFSYHDYDGGGANEYTSDGWASASEATYQGSSSYTPYNPNTIPYATREARRRTYAQQWVDWAASYGLPLFMGEYGIRNPCASGNLAYDQQYATDSYNLYSSLTVLVNGQRVPLNLPRTWWSHGFWDGNSIWWLGGSACAGTPSNNYFPYAKALTGGVTHS